MDQAGGIDNDVAADPGVRLIILNDKPRRF